MENVRRVELEELIEYSFYTPAGEDFCFVVSKPNEHGELWDYANNFDVDEHVELWMDKRGKNGVPQTVRELVEDAEWIRDRLLVLAEEGE